MKKSKLIKVLSTAAAAGVLALALASCGGGGAASSAATSAASSGSASSGGGTVTVAATPVPHADILRDAVAPVMAEKGYELVVQEFTDYVLPNTATEEGEVDANFFQHTPYLDNFNAENGTHLVSVAGVHVEPMSIYAGKTASLEGIADGAEIAVPNDATNEGRALLLLETAGLIKLKDSSNLEATPNDIAENPHNLKFTEVEAATVPQVLPDVDFAIINGNYALSANIPADKILFTEGAESPYVNVLVVKEGNENDPGIQALVEATLSDSVREYINTNYAGEVVAVF